MAAPLRVGLLGTGGVARLHAEALAAIDGVELAAVADTDRGRAASFAAEHDVPFSTAGLDALLDAGPFDAVHLCTPPAGHAEQTERVLAAGAHVVVEKPPALSLAELDRMTAAAASADRQLAIVFQQRSGTAAAHVKALLDSGALGRPLVALCQTLWHRTSEYYDVPWRGTWSSEGGGPTLGLAIHQLDLLGWLLGDWAEARGEFFRLERDIEAEDVGTGTVVFANGAVASVVTTVLAPRQASVLRIDTEFATIELEHLYGHDASHWRITPAPGVDASGWELPADDVPSGHAALLAPVYAALRGEGEWPQTQAAPARSLELVTALYGSARLGRALTPADLVGDLRGPLSAPIRARP